MDIRGIIKPPFGASFRLSSPEAKQKHPVINTITTQLISEPIPSKKYDAHYFDLDDDAGAMAQSRPTYDVSRAQYVLDRIGLLDDAEATTAKWHKIVLDHT